MVRCRHCGAENYAIDMWCSKCSQHLDWAPPAAAAPAAASTTDPIAAEPEAAPVAEPEPEVAPVTEAEPEVAPVTGREPEVAPAPAPEVAPVPAPEIALVPAREPEAGAVAAVAAAPVRRSTSRRRTGVWLLPAAAAAVLAVLLALPVAGWFRAAGQQAVSPQLPLTAGLSATASATPTPTPAETPTPSAAPTPTPAETPTPSAAPTPAQPAAQPPTVPPPADTQPVPVPAVPTTAGDPSGAIGSFYQAVAAHQFDAAAATWSGRMQANYPPAEFINRRFAYTQQMNLRAARTIANNGQVATVSIDLIEVYAGSQRHWAGTWEMVRSSSGWLLNQPNLRAAG